MVYYFISLLYLSGFHHSSFCEPPAAAEVAAVTLTLQEFRFARGGVDGAQVIGFGFMNIYF